MAYDCQEIVACLDTFELASRPEVLSHLAACPECREASRLVAELRRTRQEPSEPQLARLALKMSVTEASREERARATPWRLALLALPAAAAAGLFFYLGAHPRGELPATEPDMELAASVEESLLVEPGTWRSSEETQAALLLDEAGFTEVDLIDDWQPTEAPPLNSTEPI